MCWKGKKLKMNESSLYTSSQKDCYSQGVHFSDGIYINIDK